MVEVKPLDSISEIAKEDKIIQYESTDDEYEVYKKLIDDLSQPQTEEKSKIESQISNIESLSGNDKILLAQLKMPATVCVTTKPTNGNGKK